EILCGGAYGFIADVDTIDFNAGGTPETATEGNRGKAVFGRIKVSAILYLHARLELCQVKEVAPVNGQIFNLLGSEHSLNCSLLGVDRNSSAGHFHHLTGFSHRQLGVAVCRYAHL